MSLSKSSRLLGISRQAIYQREKRHHKRQAKLAPVTDMVMELRRFMPRLGTRKLYQLIKPKLDNAGIKLGRDGLFDHLRDQRMLVKPRKSYTKTTHSKHWMKKHPNLLQGLQYCSSVYQKALEDNGMVPSMADGYDCYQNALAERVNGIFKQEFLLYRCKTFIELKVLVAESIAIYNQMRPHLSLGMKTPEEVHKKAVA